MDTLTELSLTTRRTIRAPARRIYDAWLDPEMLARFMISQPDVTIPTSSADPRVGGRFDVMMVIDGKDLPHGGIYRELVPHSKIVFDWESVHVPVPTTVTFSPVGRTTEVVLTHTRFTDDKLRDAHLAGWAAILARLDAELA